MSGWYKINGYVYVDSDDDDEDCVELMEEDAYKTQGDALCDGSGDDGDDSEEVQEVGGEHNNREILLAEVLHGVTDIEDFCISCGTIAVSGGHPLFVGGLCHRCTGWFLTWGYQMDEEGRQGFCSICCSGEEIFICGNLRCWRTFCVKCVDAFEGEGSVQATRGAEAWQCYMCRETPVSGLLRRRHDWPTRLQTLLANQSDLTNNAPALYPPIPTKDRRGIRVLSLFDGLGTGLLALKYLGIQVERYVASEVSEAAMRVSAVRHPGDITYVGDIQEITGKQIDVWGPFDLLLGGSPCNDLSLVNPARKGLYGGSGQLFFDFLRLLNKVRPGEAEAEERPFFWLFENVVSMDKSFSRTITRHLEVSPVKIDASAVSAAHRPRHYWGNLPAMDRLIVTSERHKLHLQDCLEPGREANFQKIGTITSSLHSLRQGKEHKYPVTMNHKPDILWFSELERVLGFPAHYTDVAMMSRSARMKLLGSSWSVPVICHLLAPLKEYFASTEISHVTTQQLPLRS